MNRKDVKARIRRKAVEEARQADEHEAAIELRLRKWRRGTVWLGGALLASIAAVVPFLYGYPLHNQWDPVGMIILLLAMGLIFPFLWTAGMTYGFWRYQRDIKAIHRKFALPGSKYRTGKSGEPAQR
jgi:hypothetical protein